MLNQDFNTIIDLLTAFPDEQSCIDHLETIRWVDGVVSPFDPKSKVYSCRNGKFKCKNTGKYFNVKTNTLFEGTKLPLQKWFIAIWMVTSHKKGVSSIQLSKDIGVTQTTAWFMLHRIRKIMPDPNPEPFTGTVEVDETFVGGKNKNRHKDKKINYKKVKGRSFPDKTPVIGVLERETKRIRAYVIPSTHKKYTDKVIFDNVYPNSVLYTDEWKSYRMMGDYYQHSTVEHSKGYWANGEANTNTIEGAWSHLKRTIIGIYHQVSPKHLQAYCDEFAFRYNTKNDSECVRFNLLLCNLEQRLTYKELING